MGVFTVQRAELILLEGRPSVTLSLSRIVNRSPLGEDFLIPVFRVNDGIDHAHSVTHTHDLGLRDDIAVRTWPKIIYPHVHCGYEILDIKERPHSQSSARVDDSGKDPPVQSGTSGIPYELGLEGYLDSDESLFGIQHFESQIAIEGNVLLHELNVF